MLDRLMGVGGERPARCAELPVEVDRCAERKDARCDAGEQAGRGAGVVLESKLALERLHDRLDPLADEADRRARSLGLVCPARAQDDRAERGDGLLELFAGEALVADHELALKRLALEQDKRRLALGRIRGHEVEVADGAVGPQSSTRRMPQKEREWAARQT